MYINCIHISYKMESAAQGRHLAVAARVATPLDAAAAVPAASASSNKAVAAVAAATAVPATVPAAP